MSLLEVRTFTGRSDFVSLALKWGILSLVLIVCALMFIYMIRGRLLKFHWWASFARFPLWLAICCMVLIPTALAFVIVWGVFAILDVEPVLFGHMQLWMVLAFCLLLVGAVAWRQNDGKLGMTSIVCFLGCSACITSFFVIVCLKTDPYSYQGLSFLFMALNLVFVAMTYYFALPIPRLSARKLVGATADDIQNKTFFRRASTWKSVLSYAVSFVLLVAYAFLHFKVGVSHRGLGWLSVVTIFVADSIVMLFETTISFTNPSLFFMVFVFTRLLLILCGVDLWFVGHSFLFFCAVVFIGHRMVSNLIQSLADAKKAGARSIFHLENGLGRAIINLRKRGFGMANSNAALLLIVLIYFAGEFLLVTLVKPDWLPTESVHMIDADHEQYEFGIAAFVCAVLVFAWVFAHRSVCALDFSLTRVTQNRKTKRAVLNVGFVYLGSLVVGILMFIMTRSWLVLMFFVLLPLLLFSLWLAFRVWSASDFTLSLDESKKYLRINTLVVVYCSAVYFAAVIAVVLISWLGLNQSIFWTGFLALGLGIPALLLGYVFYIGTLQFHWFQLLGIGLGLLVMILMPLFLMIANSSYVSLGVGLCGLVIVGYWALFTWRILKEQSYHLTTLSLINLGTVGVLFVIGGSVAGFVVSESWAFRIATIIGCLLVIYAIAVGIFYFKNDLFLPKTIKMCNFAALALLFIMGLLVGFQGEGIFWGTSIACSVVFFACFLTGLAGFPFMGSKDAAFTFTTSRVFPIFKYDRHAKQAFLAVKPPLLLIGALLGLLFWAGFAAVFLMPVEVGLFVAFLSIALIVSSLFHLICLPSINLNTVRDSISFDAIESSRSLPLTHYDQTIEKLHLRTRSSSSGSDPRVSKAGVDSDEGLIEVEIPSPSSLLSFYSGLIANQTAELDKRRQNLQKWYYLNSVSSCFLADCQMLAESVINIYLQGVLSRQSLEVELASFLRHKHGDAVTIEAFYLMPEEKQQELLAGIDEWRASRSAEDDEDERRRRETEEAERLRQQRLQQQRADEIRRRREAGLGSEEPSDPEAVVSAAKLEATAIVERCKSSHVRYTDSEFTPDTALGAIATPGLADWKRFVDIYDNPQVFVSVDGIQAASANDIKQGAIGDCYYLAALSVLSLRPEFLSAAFVVAEPEVGFYAVKFFKDYAPTVVCIDDLVPVNSSDKPIFGRSNDAGEVWVPIMEKAFAKLHGEYRAIVGGFVSEALATLTGGIPEIIKLASKKAEIASGELFSRMVDYHRQGFLMGAGSLSGEDTEVVDEGIVKGHAYSILNIQDIDGLQLMQLRNPWAQREWRGDYCDDSPKWTRRLIAKLDVVVRDDGCFWMTFQDFTRFFRNLYICKIFDPSSWISTSVPGAWRGVTAGGCVNNATFSNNQQWLVIAQRPTLIQVALDQSPTMEKTESIGVSLYLHDSAIRSETGQNEIACSPIRRVIRAHFEHTINPEHGHYVIVPYTYKANIENTFVLRIWSDYPVELREL